jgi:hypothetical protein
LNEQAPLFSIEPTDENIVGAPDWAKIEAEYRAGKPLRAIAAQFGIGKSTISRKAKQEGWQRSGTSSIKDAGKSQKKPGTSDVVPPKSDGKEFDWYDDDLVVLHEQPRTALYFNEYDGLVIRQEGHYLVFDDQLVSIAPEYFESFVRKLCDLLDVQSFPARK